MKQWHAETVTGYARDLELFLQGVEDAGNATIVGVTQGPGPFTSWTVVYYEYKHDAESLRGSLLSAADAVGAR